jgi:hypothetical protein
VLDEVVEEPHVAERDHRSGGCVAKRAGRLYVAVGGVGEAGDRERDAGSETVVVGARESAERTRNAVARVGDASATDRGERDDVSVVQHYERRAGRAARGRPAPAGESA